MSDQHIIPLSPHLSPPVGDVDHSRQLSDSIGRLFEADDFSDLTLIVENCRLPVHRVVLASRSQYFRALLYGGMKESSSTEIHLKDVSAVPFKHLLQYIYTGKLNLSQFKEDVILEVLALAHQYDFRHLETSISDYLKAVLSTSNVCMIYDMANLYELTSLSETCLEFIDRNASIVMGNEQFYRLTDAALKRIISRGSFYAPEVDIFDSVRQWHERRAAAMADMESPDSETADSDCEGSVSETAASVVTGKAPVSDIVNEIRLSLVTLDDLLNVVRPSSLVSPDAILDAIQHKTSTRSSELPYRGFLFPEENVATTRLGATVVRGECRADLLNGDTQNYDLDRGFTRHAIDDVNSQIVVKLGKPCIINTIRLLLWDKDMRSYSYYIDVSIDESDWVRVVDRKSYLCRSWQIVHFPQRVVLYVRIVGTHNSVNRVFHAVALEALFTRQPFELSADGLEIPADNVATVERSACVLEGVSRTRNALISGDVNNYDWDSGYTCHQLGNGAIVIQLAQPYVISTMRLLLWDCDERSYSYTIEVSTNQTDWHMVCDRSQELCSSWQFVDFAARPVAFIKIIGLFNTANEVFHVVHFECPCSEETVRRHRGERKALNPPSSAPQLPAQPPAVAARPTPQRSIPAPVPALPPEANADAAPGEP